MRKQKHIKKQPPSHHKLTKQPPTHPKPSSTREQKLIQNLLKVIYEFIAGKNYNPLTKTELVARLQIHIDNHPIFDVALDTLIAEGKITLQQQKYYLEEKQLKPQEKLLKGIMRAHPRGFGFVECETDSDQDVFIPKPFMSGAVDGDIVEIVVDTTNISEKGPEGKVVNVLERKRKELVGIVAKLSRTSALVYSSLLGDKNLVLVPLQDLQEKLVVGDRVQLEVLEWGDGNAQTKAKLISRLGHISDPTQDIKVAILEYGIRSEFPEAAHREAVDFGDQVTSKDLEGREDLRKSECFTIDPDTAKDYDDAISLEKNKNGNYNIGIHIADVSHYVTNNSALDKEARQRCNSTYFPARCVPMLPPALSDNLCSLKEGVDRLTVSVFVELSPTGNVISTRIVRSVINSAKRFTYKEAKQVLDGTLQSKHKKTLDEMVKVCHLLKKKRAERGSVELYMPELIVLVNDKGVPTGTEIIQYDITHQMVEEFMLLANETVAKYLSAAGKELTYRVHEQPAPENLREFAALVQAFGFKLPNEPKPQDIQALFLEMGDSPLAQYLSTCYIRSMRLAIYSADNIGHYGLSLEHYCHFTSPIRRYVDTIAHRLLFEAPLDKKTIQDIAKNASDKERQSARAENSVVHLKKLRYLDTLIKESHNRQFEAVVTKIKPFGVYFDVLELMFEGFLHISELDNDYFVYDEKRKKLVGRSSKTGYHAGDKILVMIKQIDFITQDVSWEFVTKMSAEG